LRYAKQPKAASERRQGVSSLPSLSVESLLCIAQRFQTILVGILGFGGVILTLWYNAHAARRQGERVLKNEQASICAALHAELTIRRDSIQKGIADFGANRVGEIVIPIKPMSAVYHALLPRIGVLSSRKVRVVMYAYLKDDTLLRSLILFGTHDGDYVFVNTKRVDELNTMFESVLPHFERAIEETKSTTNESV
jgi:hypothetical protein